MSEEPQDIFAVLDFVFRAAVYVFFAWFAIVVAVVLLALHFGAH